MQQGEVAATTTNRQGGESDSQMQRELLDELQNNVLPALLAEVRTRF